MEHECLRYHSRLAELISLKKGEDYAKTITWIRGKVSFSILRSALLCVRGSRLIRRKPHNISEIEVDVELFRSSYYAEPIRTNLGRFSFKYNGPILWNTLDEKLKTLSLHQFKSKLKSNILNSYLD